MPSDRVTVVGKPVLTFGVKRSTLENLTCPIFGALKIADVIDGAPDVAAKREDFFVKAGRDVLERVILAANVALSSSMAGYSGVNATCYDVFCDARGLSDDPERVMTQAAGFLSSLLDAGGESSSGECASVFREIYASARKRALDMETGGGVSPYSRMAV